MNEIKMTLLDANIEEFNIAVEFEAEVDGDTFGLTKNIRTGKWNDEDKCLEEDATAAEKAKETLNKYFGIGDASEFAGLIGEEYNFFLSDQGAIFFEEPEWYAEKQELDALWALVSKPDSNLVGKNSKGILEYVQFSKNGITLFVEVTGKNGKGKHFVINNRFGSYNASNEFKRSYKKKIKQEADLKNKFEVADVKDLKDLVGETVIISYEEVNGNAFVSCSGIDE